MNTCELVPVEEQITGSNFLETHNNLPHGIDVPKQDEPWTDASESLLRSWTYVCDAKSAAHDKAERFKHRGNLCLQLVSTIIPLILAPILTSDLLSKKDIITVALLVTAGICGGAQSTLGWARVAERHSQASFNYSSLVGEAEEVLSKTRPYRPRAALMIQRFKIRMDCADRYSPPVTVHVKQPIDSSMESD